MDEQKVFEALLTIKEFCKDREFCHGCPCCISECCMLQEHSPDHWELEKNTRTVFFK